MELSKVPAARTAAKLAAGGGIGAVTSWAQMTASSAVDPNRIYQEILQHQPQAPDAEADSPLAAQAWALLRNETGPGSRPSFPPLGRVPSYNPAQDTRENFAQHCGRLATLLETLRSQGALEHEILAFRMQRQAELDQMFPLQALRLKSEEEWKAAALLMKQNGVPPEEIRKYLKRKAAESTLPTTPEVKAFIEARKEHASQIAEVSRKAGGPAPPLPGADEGGRSHLAAPPPPAPPRNQPGGKFRTVGMHKL